MHSQQQPQSTPPPDGAARRQLLAALRAALRGDAPNGILVVGPSGSGKTGLVRSCIAEIGCQVEYGNALTVRNRAYFEDMEPRCMGGSVFDFLVPAAPGGRAPPSSEIVLVVDDLDTLANDPNHGLHGLLKLLAPPPKRRAAVAASSAAAPNTAVRPAARRVCVCVATSRHKSDKHMLDLYRRCTEVRVAPPRAWDASRGAAAVAPAGVERTLYPLVHDLLTRRSADDAGGGLSEPDRVTVGLLVHENVHRYCGARASDGALAAIAHDHATADAVSTLAFQAQTWHLGDLCFALRTARANFRLFGEGAPGEGGGGEGGGDSSSRMDPPPPPPGPTTALAPSFTKLLTRCSTEAGTRAFLTDMCFRLGCTWDDLFVLLARLDAEYRGRPASPARSRRQPGGGGGTTSRRCAAAKPGTAVARIAWLHARLSARLVATSRYRPTLSMADVRRMYRCLFTESVVGRKRALKSAAAATVRKSRAGVDAAAVRGGGGGGPKRAANKRPCSGAAAASSCIVLDGDEEAAAAAISLEEEEEGEQDEQDEQEEEEAPEEEEEEGEDDDNNHSSSGSNDNDDDPGEEDEEGEDDESGGGVEEEEEE